MRPDSREGRPHAKAAPSGRNRHHTDQPGSSVRPADGRVEGARPDEVYGTSPLKHRTRRTRAEVEALQGAILEVTEEDHPLTVRGVFYRVVSLGEIPKTEKGYDAIQREVLKLRRSGELRYDYIADGTRWRLKSRSWDSVEDALYDAAVSYRRALWHEQDVYVEVWSEKDAISNIVSEITDEWDVPLLVARGFASESFLWSTAREMRAAKRPAVVYQLGDHDPSGVAAWEHVQDRLRAFAPDVPITFKRLAVTPEQIVDLELPTRPTKASDSRARNFIGESVEVDAIPTSILQRLVADAIESHIDPVALHATRVAEASERAGLLALAGGGA